MLYKSVSFLTLALLSQVTALPNPQITAAPSLADAAKPSCYSYTVTSPYLGPMYCPAFNPATCGPVPQCILLKTETLTVPCKNRRCPVTPTVTVTGGGYCPHCQKGCATYTETVTSTTGCPPVITHSAV